MSTEPTEGYALGELACMECGKAGHHTLVGVLCDTCKQEFLAWCEAKDRAAKAETPAPHTAQDVA